MTAALQLTSLLALRDVEDLAEVDLEADLAERMAEAGWVLPAPADAQALVESIARSGASALAAHSVDARAVALLG